MYGMVTEYEKQYLRDYASQQYSGAGEIVDLGCWMGATTVDLATGLHSNPNPAVHHSTIHAFDLFIWYPWMEPFVAGTPLEGKYQNGESFVDQFLEHTAPWKDQVKVYPGDLNEKEWTSGAIEFLFIDAMKTWDLLNTIVHKFFPCLIPGKSVVVQQDFTYHVTYWIQLLMYHLRDYFEPVYDVPYSASFTCRYVRQIPQELLEANYSKDMFSKEDIEAAFQYAVELVALEKKPILMTCKITALLDKHGISIGESLALGIKDLYDAQANAMHLAYYVELHREQAIAAQERATKLQEEVQTKQEKITKLQKKLKTTQNKLERQCNITEKLENQLQVVQSSKFWKLRNLWFRLKQVFFPSSLRRSAKEP